eukprot:symbB.v1.2.041463.t1/scaffold8236.1/size8019/1
MKQSNARRPCLQWAQANLLPEEQVQRVPLPMHLRGHKRLRGHTVAGPRLPTLAERVASDALGRYASLPLQPQLDEQLDQPQPEELPSQAASSHMCLSRVAHADINVWCQQCVTAGEWDDPWVEDFADDYRTCCFSADFTTVLDAVTATDEVELIMECEQWGQKVDKRLRELGLSSPKDQTRRMNRPDQVEPPARPLNPARPGHLATPLFEAWTHPAETIRLCQAEDADTKVQLGVQGPLPLDPRNINGESFQRPVAHTPNSITRIIRVRRGTTRMRMSSVSRSPVQATETLKLTKNEDQPQMLSQHEDLLFAWKPPKMSMKRPRGGGQ